MFMVKRFTALRKRVPEETRNSTSFRRRGPSQFGWRPPGWLFLVLGIALSGCALPYPEYTHLISFRWGVILPVPEGATLIHQKNAAYLLSNRRDWSLTLSVWRPSREERLRLPLGEEDFRRILDESRRLAERTPGRRWIEGSLSWLGGARGVRLDFEGPPDEGQASIYFRRGEILYHRVAVLKVKKRLYRLHLQSIRSPKDEALRFWSDMGVGIRLSGRPIVSILHDEEFPESDHFSIIRETLGTAGKKSAQLSRLN